jgi:hypothetical protein
MKYFFGFLISIGLIVLVFILIMKGFSGGSKKQLQSPLDDYAGTSSQVRLTVSGPIVGDTQFQSYQITVGRDEVDITTRQGYESNTLAERTYTNNEESYTNFLRALDLAGFAKGDKTSPNKDERGACADGDRSVMEIITGSSTVQRFWTSDCRGQGGNFKGNAANVRSLFDTQVPPLDFRTLTGPLHL